MSTRTPELRAPMTPREVLTCDVCGARIEELVHGMIFWTTTPLYDYTSKEAVDLEVAHRRCRKERPSELSQELSWWSDPISTRVVDLMLSYRWTAAQLQRLVLTAWAVPLVASREDVRRARGLRELGI